jgi:ribonuclease HII
MYTQRTIIRGDDRVPVIALASVLAKVTRDRTMEQVALHYPEYGFDQHKGYGTLEHRRAIKRHGLSAIHRRSFCSAFLQPRV